MWRTRRGLLPVAVSAAMALAACGGDRNGLAEADEPAQVHVVASFFPLAEAVGVIGGDRVAVTNVTPIGAEPHDVELTTRDVDAILDADLLIYQGGGFQPAIEPLVGQREGPSVDAVDGMALREASEDDHDDEGEEEGEEHDPHVWLDPVRYAQIVERIGTALAGVDAEGADTYRSNAEEHAAAVLALHERFDRRLRGCERDTLMVSHAAFGYLAERYGLHQEAIAGISPESEPDPRRLSELVDLVEEEGVTTVFTETLVSPEVADTLAREAGVSTAVLNPLEGLTEEEEVAGETYLSIMERNLEAIAAALGC